jgi:hypothetical protein
MKSAKQFLTIVATTFVFASVSYAADNSKTQGTMEKPNMEMMNTRMSEMQKEMDQINNTKDPKEKQALLEKHMKNMQTQMDMMGQSMKGMGMMGGATGKGKMMGKNQQGMMNQMGQMHGMMGQMMGQMQEHMNSCPYNQDSIKK